MTQRNAALVLALLLPLTVAAQGDGCSGTQPIGSNEPDPVNPTGDCQPTGNGWLQCYMFTYDAGGQWLPDCDPPLDHAYWRVHDTGAGAYVRPPLEATGITFGICDGNDADLVSLFDSNHLCQPTLSETEADAVEHLAVADALAITRALHERLRFEGVQDESSLEWFVEPRPQVEDLKEVCNPGSSSSFAQACENFVNRGCAGAGPDYLSLDEAGAADLAEALNQYYGIE
ncbi:MAG: hypothetical protein KC731_04530 [Myxococcales bacterium]|nr:hypothetical protein [Myxococcales bacterium]